WPSACAFRVVCGGRAGLPDRGYPTGACGWSSVVAAGPLRSAHRAPPLGTTSSPCGPPRPCALRLLRRLRSTTSAATDRVGDQGVRPDGFRAAPEFRAGAVPRGGAAEHHTRREFMSENEYLDEGVHEATAVIDNGAFGTRTIRFETGRLAKQAAGSVAAYLDEETMLLSATTASKQPKDNLDFFPLTVDVEERMYAAGRIPGSFFRREGRPSTDAILTCRLIDRPLRPTFTDGLRNE